MRIPAPLVGVALTIGCSGGAEIGLGFEPPPEDEFVDVGFVPESYDCFGTTSIDDQLVEGTEDGIGHLGFDAAQRLVYEEVDENNNGLSESIERFEYDGNGFRSRFERQKRFATIEEYENDDRGNMLVRRTDSDANGGFDRIEMWTYDANDEILTYDLDSNGNTRIDESEVYTRTPDGRVLVLETFEDGDLVSVSNYTYDAMDRTIEVTIDRDLEDADLDLRATFTYTSETGLDYLGEQDDGDDGIIDAMTAATFDAEGRRLTFTIDYTDEDTDDRSETNAFDNDGNATLQRVESGSLVQEQTWVYDGQGRVTRETSFTESGGNVFIDRTETTTYGGTCP
ncbi:MAG: hypothetical protein AAGA48_14630 [Myxococcota bacterium]